MLFNSYEKHFEEALEAFVQAVRPPRSVVFACYGAGSSLACLPFTTTGSRLVPAVYLLANIQAIRDFAGMPELASVDHPDMHHVLQSVVMAYHEGCECVSVISSPPEGAKAGIGEQTTIAHGARSWILTPPQVSGDTFDFIRTCQGVNHARLAHDRVVGAAVLSCVADVPCEPPGYRLQKGSLMTVLE